MIVKVPHVGDVTMDPFEASELADAIRSRLHVEMPLAARGWQVRDDKGTVPTGSRVNWRAVGCLLSLAVSAVLIIGIVAVVRAVIQ